MDYFQPDLTGQNPDHYSTNNQFVLLKPHQIVDLPCTIFYDSLKVAIVGPGGLQSELVKGVDYICEDDDIDLAETSKLLILDPSFDKKLVHRFKIFGDIPVRTKIMMSYQKVYNTDLTHVIADDKTVNFTPELVRGMLAEISRLKSRLLSPSEPVAVTSAVPRLLSIDLDRSNPENMIRDEVHTINVMEGGRNIIIPACGSFYKSTLTLRTKINGSLLIEGQDYLIFGDNLPKTRTINVPDTIADYILVNKPYAGDIESSYHAYGGDVTLSDMLIVQSTLTELKRLILSAGWMTPDQINGIPEFQNIARRVELLEEENKMRSLIKTGAPNYGDSTNGTVAIKKLQAVDTARHWYTIAELYKVDGSDEVVVADRMNFRLTLVRSQIMADVYIGVNLELPYPFLIDAYCVSQDPKFDPFVTYPTPGEFIPKPEFRIVYNKSVDGESGVLLQIGLELRDLVETLSIEDRSGPESCWKLWPTVETAITPNDTSFMLPDKVSIWDEVNPTSHQWARYLPNRTGYAFWSGEKIFSMTEEQILDPDFNMLEFNDIATHLDEHFNIKDVRVVQLGFVDRDPTATAIRQVVNVVVTYDPVNDVLFGKTDFYSVLIHNDGTGLKFNLSVHKTAITTSTVTKLRHIVVKM